LKIFIKKIFSSVDRVYNFFVLKINNVKYENDLVINGRLYCANQGVITIGRNVVINSGVNKNPLGGAVSSKLICRKGASIFIDNNVGISNSTIVSYQSIHIGKNTFIGNSVNIFDSDFHSISSKYRNDGDTHAKKKSILIEDNVFIGTHSIVLKGTILRKDTVVSAGSVVSGIETSSYDMIGGNPAVLIKNMEGKV
jgi:acetyltransferase-like isoleucine patch superfamily enzyme